MTPLVVSLFNTKSQRNKKVSVINWTSNIPSTLTDLTICHGLGRSIETIQSKNFFFVSVKVHPILDTVQKPPIDQSQASD